MKFYIVIAPEEKKGIYRSWEDCLTAVHGVKGAKYLSVKSPEEANRILNDEKASFEPGTYAFVDGNHFGGIGCVLVQVARSGKETIKEIKKTVLEVFSDMWSELEISAELARIRQILAELGGLKLAVESLNKGTSVTIVHDYTGIAEWMERRWKIKDPAVFKIVEDIRSKVEEKKLKLRFKHQDSHIPGIGGRNPFREYNELADRLATEAAGTVERGM